MNKPYLFRQAAMALAAGALLTACSDDETPAPVQKDPAQVSFIVTSGDPASDLTGGVYMKVFSDLTTVKENQQVYGDDATALRSPDSYTQVSYNPATSVFTGYIYARGASAEGIGSMKAGLRSYRVANGALSVLGTTQVEAFGNTGTYGDYAYAAQISKPMTMIVDKDGNGQNITLNLAAYAIDDVTPAVSNIVDMGSGRLAVVLNYSNRDSAAVAFTDYSLNISSVVYDNRIGTSVGAQRSVRYTQSGADDAGNVYVFSGSSATDGKVGALRINKGATAFDPSYKFDILSAADGYRFRKAFHISGSKFLLEFYLAKDAYANMDASGRMAVVDMEAQTLTWVTGLPDPTSVSVGWGDGYQGAYYLPIAGATSFSGGGGGGGRPTATRESVTPTIYRIDANTGAATPFMTFGSGDLLKAITILK